MSLARRNITQYPLLNKGKLALTPLQISRKGVLWLWKIESRASVIFLSLGETTVDGEYEPEKYGVPQIENVDLDVLGLFTSRTDKAC